MNEGIEIIKNKVIVACNEHNKRNDYDFYNNHIKLVENRAEQIAKKYNIDNELLKLSALLHDISLVLEIGTKPEHYEISANIAEEWLKEINYDENKIEIIKSSILNHGFSADGSRTVIEEKCLVDADMLAHFDAIPMLFHYYYGRKRFNMKDGYNRVKTKLEIAFNRLNDKTKEDFYNEYNVIMNKLFVN